MTGAPPNPAGELRFSTEETRSWLAKQQKAGKAVRLAPGIYVVGSKLPQTDLAKRHLYTIVAHVWPGAVLCDRTAIETPGASGWVFVCHPEPARASDLKLPGVTVSCRIGPGQLPGDMEMPEGLSLSGVARGLLENADTSGRPPKGRPRRAAGMAAVGDRIDQLAADVDPHRLSTVFAQFDTIRGYFDPGVAERVRALLAAALGTSPGGKIESERLAARVAGNPVDAARADLFEKTADLLENESPIVRSDLRGGRELEWLPFFDSYFSNYIEGTRFSVEDAYAIAIDGKDSDRPQDAHDITATYRIAKDPELMREVPRDGDDFVRLLKERHIVLMAARLDKRPGQFKHLANFAGATAFVAPTQLEGTLRAGWEQIARLRDPFQRAVMTMFVVTECHPFDDGNGRLARILTNAELVGAGQQRIIIPTAFRNNYLSALTGVTNGNGPKALVSVLDFAQRWVAAVDWLDWDRCLADVTSSNAFEEPALAESSGRRLRMPQG